MNRQKTFNENGRVQVPALVHLTRLGYEYATLKDSDIEVDADTAILQNVFRKQFLLINNLNQDDGNEIFEREFVNIKLELEQDDLGEAFFKRMLGKNEYKLIDWNNASNNIFQIVSEVERSKDDDSFRPDITVYVNGLPLSYIEVKQPNDIRHRETGARSEFTRTKERLRNKQFRVFNNITQLMVFTDNDDYALDGSDIQGSYYATTGLTTTKFNKFHEETPGLLMDGLLTIDEQVERKIASDNNKEALLNSPEYKLNVRPTTPANSILTSLFTKERFMMIMHYGIVYVKSFEGIQKHIMRYPQLFATTSIERSLESGVKKGVIWHTQGSGKTALAYYNVRYLTDYYQKHNKIPQFYFIVDRLDLATQAHSEFVKRGLRVKLISNKADLEQPFDEDIAVVNIQKFNDDTDFSNKSGYTNLNNQNIYFIDEAHRSYNPKGSYLANLYQADTGSIMLALTGTPLIVYNNHKKIKSESDADYSSMKEEVKTTRNIFGDYIHKYYYNESIADGYTLRLMREEIKTEYRNQMITARETLEQEIKRGTLSANELYAHPKYVTPMIQFIVDDLHQTRDRIGDVSIGAMVVSDSSDQARELHRQFERLNTGMNSALILHDENDKRIRVNEIQDFKDGKIDILFVYSMLITGFDAPRLKKLYLSRKVKAHNLLQTLTRVNRPYKEMRVGYVVDFADIKQEFDKTNQAYFEELNREYGTEEEPENVFGGLFVSPEEIEAQIEEAMDTLIDYPTENKEYFSESIRSVDDKNELIALRKALRSLQENFNVARLLGHFDVLNKLDIQDVSVFMKEVEHRITALNLISAENDDVDRQALLNTAIESVIFDFTKISETELLLAANDLIDTAAATRGGLRDNFDKSDPKYVSLFEEFKRLMQKYNVSQNEMNLDQTLAARDSVREIQTRINALNKENRGLANRFGGDVKYAKTFKRLSNNSTKPSANKEVFALLKETKTQLDKQVANNDNILENEPYFLGQVQTITINMMDKAKIKTNPTIVRDVSKLLTDEYEREYEEV